MSTALLFDAAAKGSVESAKEALLQGADPNTCNAPEEGRNTPLMVACVKGHVEVVKLLLENGADPSIRANGGFNALHRACFWGREEIILELISRGCDLNDRNDSGHTALALCSGYKCSKSGVAELATTKSLDEPKQMQARLQAYTSKDPVLLSLLHDAHSEVTSMYHVHMGGGKTLAEFNESIKLAIRDIKGSPQQQQQEQVKKQPRKDDGRTAEEQEELADQMLSECKPWRTIADPPLGLTHLLRNEEVAWKIIEDGKTIWMPYCAGRRRKGEEESSDF